VRGSEVERFEIRAQLIQVFIASGMNYEDSHQLLILFLDFSSTKRGSQFNVFSVPLGDIQLHLFTTRKISHRQILIIGVTYTTHSHFHNYNKNLYNKFKF